MSKRFISRLFIILFSSLMVIQSCQTPNNAFISDKKFQIKSESCVKDKVIINFLSVDDYANIYINEIFIRRIDYPGKDSIDISNYLTGIDNIRIEVINNYPYCNCNSDYNWSYTITKNNEEIFSDMGEGKNGPPNTVVYDKTINVISIQSCPSPTPSPTSTPTPEPTPSDEPCDCNNNLGGFGIKAYPCQKNEPCPDPLLYPNEDPYKNCPSFAKDQKENKVPFPETESIVIGVYDFDSGDGKPNITVVLRPNGNNNHLGGFGKNDGSPDAITQNNIDNTKVYVKDDKNKTNLLISDKKNPPKDPDKNWDFNHDAKTGTIEINTHKDNNQRASYDDILEKCSNSVESKIVQDLKKNITTNSKSSPDNIVAGHIKTDGIVASAPEASYRVDMAVLGDRKLYLPVLGIKLEDVIKTMKIGDIKTIVLENRGIFIELNIKYKGKNNNNPKESVWEVFCGRNNTGEVK